ncbi:MAG: hypothetical protein AB1938_28790, partial [Myxococcota bacterium]
MIRKALKTWTLAALLTGCGVSTLEMEARPGSTAGTHAFATEGEVIYTDGGGGGGAGSGELIDAGAAG